MMGGKKFQLVLEYDLKTSLATVTRCWKMSSRLLTWLITSTCDISSLYGKHLSSGVFTVNRFRLEKEFVPGSIKNTYNHFILW